MKRILLLPFLCSSLLAAEPTVDFARQVLPILSDKCFTCHGPDTRKKTELRLDSWEAATADRDGVKAIDPDQPEQSEILARIHDSEDPMPPKKAEKHLNDAERAVLSAWVRQGGAYAKHWAFVPPKKPAGKSIDALVEAELKANKIGFHRAADPETLARRAALVLTGLPPEPALLKRYLADPSPAAYESLVDALLASPHYGEHQARYWLDAVRYGDTHGLHLDNRRAIFPYRDWVVGALNRNMRLDEFIVTQLAGDLLPEPTLSQLVATGFVRMNPSTAEGGAIAAEFQAKNSFDRTETLGTALMGMSLLCARCHTHKYDPVTQTEYYRLYAFLNNTAEAPLDRNAYDYHPVLRVPPDQPAWEAWNQIESLRNRILPKSISPELEKAAQAHAKAVTGWKASDWKLSKPLALDQKPVRWDHGKGLPGLRKDALPNPQQARWVSFNLETKARQQLWLTFSGGEGSLLWIDGARVDPAPGINRTFSVPLSLSPGAHSIRLKMAGTSPERAIEVLIEDPWQALAKARSWAATGKDEQVLLLADPTGPLQVHEVHAAARALAPRIGSTRTGFALTLVAKELAKPRETRLLDRGEYHLPVGDPLQPGTPAVLGAWPKDAPPNRLGLAQWLTSREHPLVSRVLINRVWQRVFGDGLVRTPEDFGLQGEQPTHPELLDWMAVELQESGWDLKHMLKLMVTSRTFQQDSAARKDVDDPENRLIARGPRYRLDAEVLRDMALWASGLLDPHMGGEGVKPYQPAGLWKALMHPASNTKHYEADTGPRLYRRSLYVYWKRTSPHPMMILFDAPDRESSCVRRSRSSNALQSLGLFNETQRVEMGRAFAERLLREGDNDTERLDRLFELITCRKPTTGERAACTKLIEVMRTRYASAKPDAEALLATGDAPRDRALDPAEHAAWTQVAVTVLASDLALMLY